MGKKPQNSPTLHFSLNGLRPGGGGDTAASAFAKVAATTRAPLASGWRWPRAKRIRFVRPHNSFDVAHKIPESSPAYDTIYSHRVRLLIALKHTERSTHPLLDATLPALQRQKPGSKTQRASSLNAWPSHGTSASFLTYAPRPHPEY